MYQSKLDELLTSIPINGNITHCKDANCEKHLTSFQELNWRIIDACNRATKATIPFSKPKTGEIPGWNEHVREKRDAAMFWHSRWIEAGRPRDAGWIAEMRRRTRARYHLAVREAKRDKDLIVKRRMAESLGNGDARHFWKNISKIKNNKNTVSAVIDNARGQSACDAFKRKYSDLFNANPSGDMHMIKHEVNEDIRNRCCQDRARGNKEEHLHTITPEMIKKVISKIKKGQYDEHFKIFSESIMYGCERLFVMLSLMLSCMLRHGYTVDSFTRVSIKPIPKDKKKSLSNSENYRGIAPNATIPKLLDYIILETFPQVFSSSDNQFAYKSKFSTTMCTFMVLETIQYYRDRGSPVYVTLLDSSKAFDYVRFDIMFNKLRRKGLCPLVIRLLMNIYSNSSYRISWNGETSDYFTIKNGVKQGAVLSPILYTLYVESLLENVLNSGKGCHIGNNVASIFVYADDIILLCPS